jgi:hypothetical protein
MSGERAPEKPRADLLAEIASLPTTAFVTPMQAAAYIGSTTSVMYSWRSQRRGPRYHGANEFIRYRICDLDCWMATRAGEVLEATEGARGVVRPRLVWPCDQSEDTQAADQRELNAE